MTKRNLAAIRVPASAIAEIVKTTAWIGEDRAPAHPFPDDTQYIRAYYDAEIDSFILIFEHPSFYATPEGAQIYRLHAVMPPVRQLLVVE